MNNRCGFTIIECVVAMAVVVIVSLSVMTSLQMTVNETKGIMTRYDAVNYADNLAVCWRRARTHEEFETLVSDLLEEPIECVSSSGGESESTRCYERSLGGYRVSCSLTYPLRDVAEEAESENECSFSFSVEQIKNGKIYLSHSYTRFYEHETIEVDPLQ